MISLDEGNTMLTLDDMLELSARPASAAPQIVTHIESQENLPKSLVWLTPAQVQELEVLVPAFGQPVLL